MRCRPRCPASRVHPQWASGRRQSAWQGTPLGDARLRVPAVAPERPASRAMRTRTTAARTIAMTHLAPVSDWIQLSPSNPIDLVGLVKPQIELPGTGLVTPVQGRVGISRSGGRQRDGAADRDPGRDRSFCRPHPVATAVPAVPSAGPVSVRTAPVGGAKGSGGSQQRPRLFLGRCGFHNLLDCRDPRQLRHSSPPFGSQAGPLGLHGFASPPYDGFAFSLTVSV